MIPIIAIKMMKLDIDELAELINNSKDIKDSATRMKINGKLRGFIKAQHELDEYIKTFRKFFIMPILVNVGASLSSACLTLILIIVVHSPVGYQGFMSVFVSLSMYFFIGEVIYYQVTYSSI